MKRSTDQEFVSAMWDAVLGPAFAREALAHVESLEADKQPRMMRGKQSGIHQEGPLCKEFGCTPEPETTAELVSRVVPENSHKWLPWKLSPDSDPSERWILVSAENDEIEHPDGAKYDTEAQAWIACDRESK